MCLLVYSEVLPRLVHDEIMKTLESDVGQQAAEFSDALFRQTMSDGRNALQALHSEGFIKKVPTNQVVVTPTGNSSVRLDELNSILSKMKDGEDAVKKMSNLDNNAGIKDSRKATAESVASAVAEPVALTDADLAANMKTQAETMKRQADVLIAEATRLEQEAAALVPQKAKNVSKKSKAAVQ